MINFGDLFTIFKRENKAYFNSPIAYIFIIVFVLLGNGLFMTQFFIAGRADMRAFFGTLPLILAVFLPAVTMRLWAEEKKGNTLELLLTFPMRTHELVLGKFVASLVFYLVALASTVMIPVMLFFLGKPDLGAMASAYLGAVLLGAFFLAIGIFVSGIVRDQIIAFILSMMVCFSLYVVGTGFFASAVDGWIPGMGSFLRNFLGVTRHFDSFARGVVDNRDVVYFILGSAIFLTLNGFWLEGRMRPKAKAIFTTAALVCAGIFLTANWLLAEIPLGRFDMTQGQIYTISPWTEKLLQGLKAPVTAKLYISPSEKMPTGLKPLEQEIVDKLDEFRIAAKGKFQYKIFHMEAANVTAAGKQKEDSLEQQLSEKGIKPFQVQSIQADEVGMNLVYSALSLAYKEKPEEIIGRVIPDNIAELEYLIISRIYRMMLPEPPQVALMAPYKEKEMEPELKPLVDKMGGKIPEGYKEDNYELLPMALGYAGYKTSRIKLTEKEPIPEGTKTLIVVDPNRLEDRQRYEMDRFLAGGGSLLLAVQDYEYNYTISGKELSVGTTEKKPQINPLITGWGFEVDDQILVDEQNDVVNVSGAARLGPYELSVPVKIPIQILVNQSGMNPDVSITSRLSPLFYLWGTRLKLNDTKIKSQGLKVETLLTSSKDSWTVPFKSESLTPKDLSPLPDSPHGPFPLAVMAQGLFQDLYAEKQVPAWPQSAPAGTDAKAIETPAPKPLEPHQGKMILMGASSFFQKHLLRNSGHLTFFLNCVDALALGDELVRIRSKQPIERTIDRVSSATKVIWRFAATLLVPIVIALIGVIKGILRKRSKQAYLKMLSLVE
jgi:ABC-type transport system involved in multi-copper enzyme maturation permease subunit